MNTKTVEASISIKHDAQCYFCFEFFDDKFLIHTGDYVTCCSCWKRFAIFVREWMAKDVFKYDF